MSSPRQAKPTGLTPPPLPARAQKERARVRRRPAGKPPPIEFLPEEFVKEEEAADACEELPDEFVIEDGANVVFAGPSDAPPRPEIPAPAVGGGSRSQVSANLRQGRSMRTAWLFPAAGVAVLGAMAWSIGSAPTHSPIALADPAASHARGSGPLTEDPPSNSVSASSLATGASAMQRGSDNVVSAEGGASSTPGVVSPALTTKNSSQQALEQGKVGLAIELGEHAVELDPSDADSWLILGAAYMQRGDNKNARRCFASCVKQATAGAKKECAAMLR